MPKLELVRDWMTRDPITVSLKTSMLEAHRIMTNNEIRRLPVLDGEELVGIVTLGDVRGAGPSEAPSLSIWEVSYQIGQMTVDQIMAPTVIVASPDMTIYEAARLMLLNKIAGLPVMEGGKLVGILTESDVFRMIVESQVDEATRIAPD